MSTPLTEFRQLRPCVFLLTFLCASSWLLYSQSGMSPQTKEPQLGPQEPLRTARASRVDQAPRMDGTLDDPLWQKASFLVLCAAVLLLEAGVGVWGFALHAQRNLAGLQSMHSIISFTVRRPWPRFCSRILWFWGCWRFGDSGGWPELRIRRRVAGSLHLGDLLCMGCSRQA